MKTSGADDMSDGPQTFHRDGTHFSGQRERYSRFPVFVFNVDLYRNLLTNVKSRMGKSEEQLPQKTVGRQLDDSRTTVGGLLADCRLAHFTKILLAACR